MDPTYYSTTYPNNTYTISATNDQADLPDYVINSEKSCSEWIWIIIIIILLLVIAGLIVWLVLCLNRNKNQKDRVIELNNVQVLVNSDTQLSASWDKTDNDNDVITCYISKDPPKQNSDGTVTNTSFTPVVAAKGATNLVFPNITPKDIYHVTIVATNSETSHYKSSYHLVYMQIQSNITSTSASSTKQFQISDITTLGVIALSSSNPENVIYTTSKDEDNQDNEWYFLVSNGSNGTIRQEVGNDTYCLYAKTETNGDVVLAAETCTNQTINNNGRWVYGNYGGVSNRWCLATDTSKCMELDSTSSTIKIVENSANTNQWVNELTNTNT